MILLVILGYFLIGFITGIVICKIKGKEWCRANTSLLGDDENNAEFIMFFSTFAWVLFVVLGPLVLLIYIVEYTSKKLQQ